MLQFRFQKIDIRRAMSMIAGGDIYVQLLAGTQESRGNWFRVQTYVFDLNRIHSGYVH